MKMKDFNINMTQYKRGDIITGTIVMIGEKDVIVALGGLKEGVFSRSELPDAFRIGDAILIMVTGGMDDKGCLIVTHAAVNKAIEDKEKLKDMKLGSEIRFKVSEATTAGLIGEFVGYRIFLPFSQLRTEDYVNKDNIKDSEIIAVVIELDNIKKSIVCSSKLLESIQEIKPISIGDELIGTVIKLEDKYAIVLLENGSKAKLSISDIDYERTEKIADKLTLNEKRKFKILEVNSDLTRVSVGLKQLQSNPLDGIYQNLNIGDEIVGEVVKIMPIGALIRLDNGLTALAITKENTDKSNVLTHHIYKLGSKVTGYISKVDRENYRLNIITNK